MDRKKTVTRSGSLSCDGDGTIIQSNVSQTKTFANTKSRLFIHTCSENADKRNVFNNGFGLNRSESFPNVSTMLHSKLTMFRQQQSESSEGFGIKPKRHNQQPFYFDRTEKFSLKELNVLNTTESEREPGGPSTVFAGSINTNQTPTITTQSSLAKPSITLSLEKRNLDVDVQNLKQCLKSTSSPIKKFDLMQSLTLKFSNQEPADRIAIVQTVIDNDLFDLRNETRSISVIEDILWPVNTTTPHPLQSAAAKLLNAIVSHEIGREYFSQTSIVKLFTWSSKENISDSMAGNLMSTMKKLSLNQFQRHDMLEKGLISWLTKHMEVVERTASPFHMECTTDLLRMLINDQNSVELVEESVSDLIMVLVRYLNSSNEYVQVNVAHVLRQIFQKESSAVEIAHKLNVKHQAISDHIENASNSKLREDLRFIRDSLVNQPDMSDKVSSPVHTIVSFGNRDKNNDDQSERMICENNLMERSETQHAQVGSCIDVLEALQSLPLDVESTGGRRFTRSVSGPKLDEEMKNNKTESVSECERNEGTSSTDAPPHADILFSNLNSRLDQSSSFLSSDSRFVPLEHEGPIWHPRRSVGAMADVEPDHMDIDRINNRFNVPANNPPTELHSKKIYEDASAITSIDYSDLSSITRDPDARHEILENDSFIDELCDKVLMRLKLKLKQNFFCGPSCGTNVPKLEC